MFAVPNKQRWARTAAAVDLEEIFLLVRRHFNFILQNAGGPEHAHHVGLLRLTQADGEIWRVLAEISVRAVDLKFLANAVGENFDLGADGALVVVQSLEREPQPVVLVAAFVLQQDGGAVVLSDEQVGRAVVIEVSRDDGARIFELNLVEAHVGGDVFPSIGTKIAE